MSSARKKNPQEAVFAFRRNFFGIECRGELDFAFELTMVNLHRYYTHRFARGHVDQLALLKRFGCRAVTAYPKPVRGDRNFDLVWINAGKFHAYPKAAGALENIDVGTPGIVVFSKIREVNLCDLVSYFAYLSCEIPQANGANFLTHDVKMDALGSRGNNEHLKMQRI